MVRHPSPCFSLAAVLLLGALSPGWVVALPAQMAPKVYEVSYRMSSRVSALDMPENRTDIRFRVSASSRDTVGGRIVAVRLDSVISSQLPLLQGDSTGVPPEIWATMTRGPGLTVTGLQQSNTLRLLGVEPLFHPLAGPLRATLGLIFPPLSSGREPGQQWADTLSHDMTEEDGGIFNGFLAVRDSSPLIRHWSWGAGDSVGVTGSGSYQVTRWDIAQNEILTSGVARRVTQQYRLDDQGVVDSGYSATDTSTGVGMLAVTFTVSFTIRRLNQ